MTWAFTAADCHAALEYVSAAVALCILLSAVDDLFFDGWYWWRRFARWWSLERSGRVQPLTAAQLHERAQQPIAIMVPAWKEHDVIAAMVENMVKVLDYQRYVVFVGTYCNDAETIAEAEKVARRYRQVKRVEVPHPGPTCKADCLNFVVEAIFAHERETGTQFAGVLLHDSEDVLHPLELKFFNYLLPRKDMIQLPVASLERGLFEWVAGTYMDEFAESHGKEMIVRESIAGTVPSAGVGTCFSRRALLALVGATRNHPFNTESLTEDYDVGMRLQALGMESIFGLFPVDYRVKRKGFSGREHEVAVRAPLSVREFFPDSFRAAYRQKSRWALGIGLQGWHQIPWGGRSAAARYLLLHDRKGMITSFIGIFAYVLLLQLALLQAGQLAGWWDAGPATVFVVDSPWTALVWINAAFLALRVGSRMFFTARLYGWRHGLMAAPRMIVGNFVNCLAVGRAWRMYLASVFFGRKLVWDKTAHEFPAADPHARKPQSLGELLQLWQVLQPQQLEEVLAVQAREHQPLGQLLLARGLVDEETLAEAIACQADLPRAQLAQEAVCSHAHVLPLVEARRWRAVSLGQGASGQPLLAVARALDADALAAVTQLLGAAPVQRVARDSEIDLALQWLAQVAEPVREEGPMGVNELLAETEGLLRGALQPALVTNNPSPVL